jgi:hypothetical protein
MHLTEQKRFAALSHIELITAGRAAERLLLGFGRVG